MNNSISMPNQEIIQYAKEKVSANWGMAILAFVIYIVVSSLLSFVPFGSIILTGPLVLGLSIWSLNILRNDEFDLESLFAGFNNFAKALGTYLLMVLLIILWSLLFIIPGIVKSLAYSQVIFILADEPEIGAMDALRKSEAMMKGNKTKYFLLGLILGLLAIACIFTLGIGFLFLFPVSKVAMAKFYEEVRMKYDGESGFDSEIEMIGEVD
ncbi:MAG: DUF975 family protein [Bacteroidetes bacterium]|jgi:uncharacterized membrane protein|nr:DUF975 family protein [Bacteroidota bacterium]MDA8930203.1 DUF975 family protein [Bacteroidia bacterium]